MKVKIFCGSPGVIQNEINEFLGTINISRIQHVLQSESDGGDDSFSVTVSIWYVE